jgi:NTP pyrophosphatase (non-canonical NTP hydrolase)
MDFGEYQTQAKKFKKYPMEFKVIYPALGLASEAGEVLDKIKKVIRDKNNDMNDEDRVEILKEIGDVLWYCSTLCDDLNMPLDQAAAMNLNKLNSRLSRDVISGSGDNR